MAHIGQLADAAGCRGRNDEHVEIRIVLDRIEPPVGRLRIARDPPQVHRPRTAQDIGFTGWLGLLRALYEVTAPPDGGSDSGS